MIPHMVETGTELSSEEKGRGQLRLDSDTIEVDYEIAFYQTIGKTEMGGPSVGSRLLAGEGKVLSMNIHVVIPLGLELTLVLSDGRRATVVFETDRDFKIQGAVR
jgi:hypothetical protein